MVQERRRSPELVRALGVSLSVAVVSTALSLTLGTLAAFALVRYSFPGRAAFQLVFVAPLVFPALVYGVAMLMALSPLKLTRTVLGLTLAHVVITMPYVLRTVSATLHGVDRRLEESAQILGANPWRTFWHVTFLLRLGSSRGDFPGSALRRVHGVALPHWARLMTCRWRLSPTEYHRPDDRGHLHGADRAVRGHHHGRRAVPRLRAPLSPMTRAVHVHL
jgi:hypothetical protein